MAQLNPKMMEGSHSRFKITKGQNTGTKQGNRVLFFVLGIRYTRKMASRASFRRKPEPRNASFSATFALVTKGVPAPMPSGGLCRNDEVEQVGSFPYYFTPITSGQHERVRTPAFKTRLPCPSSYADGQEIGPVIDWGHPSGKG